MFVELTCGNYKYETPHIGDAPCDINPVNIRYDSHQPPGDGVGVMIYRRRTTIVETRETNTDGRVSST